MAWRRAGDMWGPDFEYHLFTAATGVDLTREEFEQACERVFNTERVVQGAQLRARPRPRRDGDALLRVSGVVGEPLPGEKKKLERDKFLPMLERYYRLPWLGRAVRPADLEEAGRAGYGRTWRKSWPRPG